MSTEVRVPTLGESVTEATIATWFKQPGDTIAVDEMLCELETDKVSVEVPAPVAGVLKEHVVNEGDTVEVNALLAMISEGEQTGAAAHEIAPKEIKNDGKADTRVADAPKLREPKSDVEDAPSAKKLMAEKGISREDVKGTGRDDRIMKSDVQNHEKKPDTVTSSLQNTGDNERRVKMTRLRQTIARRLKEAQNTAAMLTTYNEVDMSAIMTLRKEYKEVFEKKHGTKLGFMSFFVKACTHALHEIPAINAEIDDNDIVYKNYYHIGVAVGTPSGLVVPVVRDADQMSFATIEKTIASYGAKARDNKISMAEMQGGTFTISNGGVYGSLMSSPILNPPQSGILGMHKIQERPVVIDGQIAIRPMMYLALSYDHRIVDGKEAVTFLVRVKDSLEDPRRLLMDL